MQCGGEHRGILGKRYLCWCRQPHLCSARSHLLHQVLDQVLDLQEPRLWEDVCQEP